ncbi:MAG: L-2-amino-thiazoline-4-carboxylic acid hydrolase [Candidatus Helarchaeota archaeon]|nr:L-2-amino-thiazoline-4-carboxylic acid hydrolase [Candidatus Helarchaeota archaeon]
MSVLASLYQQYLELAKAVLKKRYERDLSNQISLQIEIEYKPLMKSSSTQQVMPQEINQRMHMVTPLFVIALYRALKVVISPTISLNQVKEIMMETFREFVGPLAEMQRNRLKNVTNKWDAFKDTTIFGTNNTYSSFEPEFVQTDETILEFHLHKCIFYEVFRAHGEESLTPILCAYDDIFAEAVEEWIIFQRPKTIADGYEQCIFYYEKK